MHNTTDKTQYGRSIQLTDDIEVTVTGESGDNSFTVYVNGEDYYGFEVGDSADLVATLLAHKLEDDFGIGTKDQKDQLDHLVWSSMRTCRLP